MKKLIIAIILVTTSIFVFLSIREQDESFHYLALGDSITKGYKVEKSYSDYIFEHYDREEKIKSYSKEFSELGYTTHDLISDIKNEAKLNNKYLVEEIRKADVITISIGSNNVLQNIDWNNLLELDNNIYDLLNEISVEIFYIVESIHEINPNCEVILVGFYNPIYNENFDIGFFVDEYFDYMDMTMKENASKYDKVIYVDLYNSFKANVDYTSEEYDYHPSPKGHQKIAEIIIQLMETKIFK